MPSMGGSVAQISNVCEAAGSALFPFSVYLSPIHPPFWATQQKKGCGWAAWATLLTTFTNYLPLIPGVHCDEQHSS